jgi:hypothetical protein
MFREAGTQVSPVTMSRPSLRTCSTLFTTGYKRLTEGGLKAFCFGAFCFRAFALGAFALDFWLFDVGGLWKGKGLLKGK